MEKVNVYRLSSCPMIHTPGIFKYWINGYRTTPEFSFWHAAMGFPMLPAALIADVLSERCPYKVEGDVVVIEWSKPMGEFTEYHKQEEMVESGD